jgi:hypothetical protein
LTDQGAKREHGRGWWRHTVHWLVPRQGRSLCCEVVRISREGQEFCLRAARGRPRRSRSDCSAPCDSSGAIQAECGGCGRMAWGLGIGAADLRCFRTRDAGTHYTGGGGSLLRAGCRQAGAFPSMARHSWSRMNGDGRRSCSRRRKVPCSRSLLKKTSGAGVFAGLVFDGLG